MNVKTDKILSLKQQYEIMDGFLRHRLEEILPRIMKDEGFDMWIIAAREYNEDPVFLTMVPALERTASRLSCLAFCLDETGGLECLSLCRPNPNLEKYYKRVWDSRSETQLQCISRLVREREPHKIGVNISDSFALADGLTKTLHDYPTGLSAALHHGHDSQ